MAKPIIHRLPILEVLPDTEPLEVPSGKITTSGGTQIDLVTINDTVSNISQKIEWVEFDGSTNVFTLSYTPLGDVQVREINVSYGGALDKQAGVDYSIDDKEITFTAAAADLTGKKYTFIYLTKG